jgi:hypothetical protein
MFLPDGVVGDHAGQLDGCSDYIPTGIHTKEFLEINNTKTPVNS